MNHTIKLLTLTVACWGLLGLNIAQAAQDDPHWYFGLDYTRLDAQRTTTQNTEADAALITFGYDLNNWFALEAHGGVSSTSGDASTVTSKIEFLGFAGARFNLRLEKFVPYVIVGASYAREKLCLSGACTTDDDTSAAGGFGFDVYGTKDTSLHFSAMLYNTKTNVDLYAYSIGFKWYFDLVDYAPRY